MRLRLPQGNLSFRGLAQLLLSPFILMFVLAGLIFIGGLKYINYTTGTFLSVNAMSIFSILFGAALFGMQVWDGSLTAFSGICHGPGGPASGTNTWRTKLPGGWRRTWEARSS